VAELTESAIPAWSPLPNERPRAHQAACAYFEMGPGRSVSAVSTKLGKNRALIGRWSKKFDWGDRAAAYDAHMAREGQNAIEKRARERAAEHQRREEELSELMYQTQKKGLIKIGKMWEYPLASVTKEDGKTTVNPARWDHKDAAFLLRVLIEMDEARKKREPKEEGDLVNETFSVDDYK
jgi:hypothetical protein